MKLNKLVLASVIGLSTLSMSGCIVAAVALGAGTVAYVDGKYSMNMGGSLTTVYEAVIKTLKADPDYVIVSKTETDKDAEVDAATKSTNKDFYVKVDKISDTASKVTIKFGTFGDQEQSLKLMDKIQANVRKS
jgi:hypothetical protein